MLPERAQKMALARADLLRLYRRAAAGARPGQAGAAKAALVEAYNLGAYAGLYAVLGPTSRASLERWDRILRLSGDPWDLAPKWGISANLIRLSQHFVKKISFLSF